MQGQRHAPLWRDARRRAVLYGQGAGLARIAPTRVIIFLLPAMIVAGTGANGRAQVGASGDPDMAYKLLAVLIHSGTTRSGHYWAYVRTPCLLRPGRDQPGGWVCHYVPIFI